MTPPVAPTPLPSSEVCLVKAKQTVHKSLFPARKTTLGQIGVTLPDVFLQTRLRKMLPARNRTPKSNRKSAALFFTWLK